MKKLCALCLMMFVGLILLSCKPGVSGPLSLKKDLPSIAKVTEALSANATDVSSLETPGHLPNEDVPPPAEHIITAEPSPTPQPITLNAVVWKENPSIPILNFHRFSHRPQDEETGTLMRLSNFQAIIRRLYDAGYSLISVRDYLDGRIVVPEGRRPLILSVDDAYFANQWSLESEGKPSTLSGIGWLYQFAQDHPDFGFEVAMFANFGDKLYGNVFYGDWWYLGDHWEQDFAKALVWGIEHHVVPLNHLFQHPDLEVIRNGDILPQIQKNDEYLRDYLKLANRQDLAETLPNVIALPYGKWPLYDSAKEIIFSYVNPEGKALEAVFEAGYEYFPKMSPSPLDDDFDRFHIPRMAPINRVVKFVVDSAPDLPAAQKCVLSLPAGADPKDSEVLSAGIQQATQNKTCPEGVYIIDGQIFIARSEGTHLWARNSHHP